MGMQKVSVMLPANHIDLIGTDRGGLAKVLRVALREWLEREEYIEAKPRTKRFFKLGKLRKRIGDDHGA